MLNVYDISIDQGTSALASNLNGRLLFNASSSGRIVLSTNNVKEASPSFYYSDVRVNANPNVQKGLQAFLWGNNSTKGYIKANIDSTTSGTTYTLTKKNNITKWEATVDSNAIAQGTKNLLSNTTNWNGTNYTGSTITGTFGGQQYADSKFWYLAITDNSFIRIPRYEYTASNLVNNSITYSKIQTVAGNKILGNTGVRGNVEELALTSGLSLSGNTIGITTNGVTNTLIRQSAGVSIIGRSVNSTGNIADITASSDGQVLKRVGSVVGFHSIGTNDLNNSSVTYAKMQGVTQNMILGNVGAMGPIEELALTSGLSFSGRTILADYTNSPYKHVCRVTTTAALTVTYSNGVNGVGATMTNATTLAAISIDSVALAIGDRVLVKNQASTFQNGIYVVTTVGSGAVAWVLTRATDSDTAIKIYQATITIKEGTVFATTTWTNSNTSTAITMGTTAISYLISGGLVISSGLNLTNKTLVISTAGVTRAMLSNAVGVSIIGRSVNSSGAPADIAASSDGQVLKRVGGVVGFNSIGTADINNSVVTYAKIQNITANRLLGRVTSLGVAQELSVSSGLTLSGASIATISSGSNGNIQFNNSSGFGADSRLFWNNTNKSLTVGGSLIINPNTVSSGTPRNFIFTGAPHTNLTASTEMTDINYNLSRTVQFATGAITTQRAFIVQPPTYGFVGASVITDAYTLFISGAPIVGTNATITNSWALGVSGDVSLDGNIKLKTAGQGLSVKSGANSRIGQATLATGSVVVANTSVTTNTRIFLSGNGITNAGHLGYTISAGVSFTILSSNPSDARLINWYMVEST